MSLMTQHETRKDCIWEDFAFRKYYQKYSKFDFSIIQNLWEIRLVFMLGVRFLYQILIEVKEVHSIYSTSNSS